MYKTNLKLGLDTEQVVVMEDDFLNAMAAMVPSTHRVYDQHQMPLPTNIKPLLQDSVAKICQMVIFTSTIVGFTIPDARYSNGLDMSDPKQLGFQIVSFIRTKWFWNGYGPNGRQFVQTIYSPYFLLQKYLFT